MVSAAQKSLRADALLSDELARIHDARAAITTEANATVCTVLRSLAQDPKTGDPAAILEAARIDVLIGRAHAQQSRLTEDPRDAGNLLSDGTTTYSYDGANRLIQTVTGAVTTSCVSDLLRIVA